MGTTTCLPPTAPPACVPFPFPPPTSPLVDHTTPNTQQPSTLTGFLCVHPGASAAAGPQPGCGAGGAGGSKWQRQDSLQRQGMMGQCACACVCLSVCVEYVLVAQCVIAASCVCRTHVMCGVMLTGSSAFFTSHFNTFQLTLYHSPTLTCHVTISGQGLYARHCSDQHGQLQRRQQGGGLKL